MKKKVIFMCAHVWLGDRYESLKALSCIKHPLLPSYSCIFRYSNLGIRQGVSFLIQSEITPLKKFI